MHRRRRRFFKTVKSGVHWNNARFKSRITGNKRENKCNKTRFPDVYSEAFGLTVYTRNHFWSQRREIRRPCILLAPAHEKTHSPSFTSDSARRPAAQNIAVQLRYNFKFGLLQHTIRTVLMPWVFCLLQVKIQGFHPG